MGPDGKGGSGWQQQWGNIHGLPSKICMWPPQQSWLDFEVVTRLDWRSHGIQAVHWTRPQKCTIKFSHWLTNPTIINHDNCFVEQPSGSWQQQQFKLTSINWSNMLRQYNSMTTSTTTWSTTKRTEWLLYTTVYVEGRILQRQTEDHQWR